VIADAFRRAVAFPTAPGQSYELPHVVPLLGSLSDVPTQVVADRGYTNHAFVSTSGAWEPDRQSRRSAMRPQRSRVE
jgi:hypothetical protein